MGKRACTVLLACSWMCLVLSAGFLAGYSVASPGPLSPSRFLAASLILMLLAISFRMLLPPKPRPDLYDPQSWPGDN